MKTEDGKQKKIEAGVRRRTRKFWNGVLLGGRAVDVREARAMARRYSAATRLVLVAETACAEVCEGAGVPGLLRFWYVSFAREVYGLWRRHWPVVYVAELPAVMFKWENRGLAEETLRHVERAVVAALEDEERSGRNHQDTRADS